MDNLFYYIYVACFGLLIVLNIVSAIVKLIKNKNAKANDLSNQMEQNNICDTLTKISQLVLSVPTIVKSIEDDYKTFSEKGFKMGKFKLKDALSAIESKCTDFGIPYDADFWSTVISDDVDLLNYSVSNQVDNIEVVDNMSAEKNQKNINLGVTIK